MNSRDIKCVWEGGRGKGSHLWAGNFFAGIFVWAQVPPYPNRSLALVPVPLSQNDDGDLLGRGGGGGRG